MDKGACYNFGSCINQRWDFLVLSRSFHYVQLLFQIPRVKTQDNIIFPFISQPFSSDKGYSIPPLILIILAVRINKTLVLLRFLY